MTLKDSQPSAFEIAEIRKKDDEKGKKKKKKNKQRKRERGKRERK